MLKQVFDKDEDGVTVVREGPSPRPRDAATLILVRRDQTQPRVLMGKRAGTNSFMPDKYVFPGGRVDPHDSKAVAWAELTAPVEEKLRVQSRRVPRAFALTAVRETFEETGLIVGRSAEMPALAPAGWEDFHRLDLAPDLSPLIFIGRAVTPPSRHKRFDARFFMAEAEVALIDERPPVDGAELSDLQWVTLADAMKLDLPTVTRFMLGEIGERFARPGDIHNPPFLRWSRGGNQTDRI
jgi:8-oxo-dGTP pyrophosphatase MutT (NUDIX family)